MRVKLEIKLKSQNKIRIKFQTINTLITEEFEPQIINQNYHPPSMNNYYRTAKAMIKNKHNRSILLRSTLRKIKIKSLQLNEKER